MSTDDNNSSVFGRLFKLKWNHNFFLLKCNVQLNYDIFEIKKPYTSNKHKSFFYYCQTTQQLKIRKRRE